MFNTALIITTYNRPDALDRVLLSTVQQQTKPDQVIIADDGSTDDTSQLIQSWRSRLPLVHAWQPDQGFRAARARNLAIEQANAEHLILIDGDCLLPPNFVAAHRRLISPKRLIAGGRLLLTDEETTALLAQPGLPSFAHWKFRGIPLGFLRDRQSRQWTTVRSCNLSIMRRDALSVGGFDESYEGWGLEDSDFVVRLLHAGCRIRQGRFAASVMHLFHPEQPRDFVSHNASRFNDVLGDPSRIMSRQSRLVSP